MYIGLHMKYLLVLSDFNQTWIFLTDFQKINNKFHENSFSGSQVVPWRKIDEHREGWTDMMKLTVTFSNFVNVSKNEFTVLESSYSIISHLP